MFLRRSAADLFTVRALHRTADGPSGPIGVLSCTASGAIIAFDAARARIDLVLGDRPGREAIELVRDAVHKHQENRGAAVLHATPVHTAHGAVLTAGAKGSGTSTVALERTDALGGRLLCGDKAVARLQGADHSADGGGEDRESGGPALCSGRPDHPHLGFATLVKYPELMEAAGLPPGHRSSPDHAFSPLGTYTVPPQEFRRRFPAPPVGTRAPVRAVVSPDIGPGARTELTPTDHTPDRVASFLESAFASPDAFRHRAVPDRTASTAENRGRVVQAIASVPAFTLTGPGALSPGMCRSLERALRAPA